MIKVGIVTASVVAVWWLVPAMARSKDLSLSHASAAFWPGCCRGASLGYADAKVETKDAPFVAGLGVFWNRARDPYDTFGSHDGSLPGGIELNGDKHPNLQFAIAVLGGVQGGWAARGGIERRASPSVSIGRDYLHYDFGTVTATGVTPVPVEVYPRFESDVSLDTVRIG